MKTLKDKKSCLLLSFLVVSTVLIALVFRGGIALTLMSFFTLMTAIYVGLKHFNQKQQNKWLRWIQRLFRLSLLVFGSLSVLILTLVSIPQFTCQRIDERAKEADHMIILGAGLWYGDQLSYTLRTRLEKAMRVFQVYPDLTLIASGGQGPDETISEAQAMKDYLIKNGVPESQIIMEDQSRSTYENLLFSKKELASSLGALQQQKDEPAAGAVLRTGPASMTNKPIIILTSDFHQFRANFIARRLGLDPIGICSPVFLSLKAVYMIREIPAVMNDFLGNILK